MRNVFLIIYTFFLLAIQALATGSYQIEELARFNIAGGTKFQKTTIGGISGLWHSPKTNSYWGVSDDRGNVNDPRMYEFSLEYKKKEGRFEFKFVPQKVINVHGSGEKKWNKKGLDIEGIAPLPWGGILLSSEGDTTKKPRLPPRIFEIKYNGDFVRDYVVPDAYIPEATGKITKGAKNNLAFEGLTVLPSGKILVALEAPLTQDQFPETRWLLYNSEKAWALNFEREFIYNLAPTKELLSQTGVSEVLAISENHIFVLEREFGVGEGIGFHCSLYFVEIEHAPTKDLSLKMGVHAQGQLKNKTLIWKTSGRFSNFEGMSHGPEIEGNKTIFISSDNNFSKGADTEFVWLMVKEKSGVVGRKIESIKTPPGTAK